MTTLRIHPNNPKLFEFRSAPLVLLTATEHYGSVMNRPFNFEKYLADTAEKKITFTRLFILFRELQSAINPYSTCKPESPDYIAPFKRVGPGKALDGQPKFDLDQWNPEFFDRLHRFLNLASSYGIVVEIVLLSNTYGESIWALNPLHPRNNFNATEEIHWSEYMTQRATRIFKYQSDLVRKIVQETNPYNNIIYEICNEPGGSLDQPGSPTMDEVNEWQKTLAVILRTEESGLENRHLIAGQEAFAYSLPDESQRSGPDVHQFADWTFNNTSFFDVANMHPLSNMVFRGKHYDLGLFMDGRLCLKNFRKYCLDLYSESKPLNLDEDNAASQYKDTAGWTIHRKRAWTALFCGAHYDMIDFSIINYCESGTPDSQRHLRSWMKNLSEYLHSQDLVRSRPAPHVVKENPPETLPSVLAIESEDYSIYLADWREWDDSGAGNPVSGWLTCDLPEGNYITACYSPTTGQYSPWLLIESSKIRKIKIPQFTHDLVLRIKKR
jgi:hypothetical protein